MWGMGRGFKGSSEGEKGQECPSPPYTAPETIDSVPETGNALWLNFGIFLNSIMTRGKVIKNEIRSAIGKENQIPLSPKNSGSKMIRGINASTWRERESNMAGTGLPRAWKNAGNG